jgi:hypothetical protein
MYIGKKLIKKLVIILVHLELNYCFPKDEGIFLHIVFCSLTLCFICYAFEVYKIKSIKVSKKFWFANLLKFILGASCIYIEPYSMSTFSVVLYAKELTVLEYFNSLIENRTEYIRLYSEASKAACEAGKTEDDKVKEYGKKLDRLEKLIDELQEKHGFEDPADFAYSEGSNN